MKSVLKFFWKNNQIISVFKIDCAVGLIHKITSLAAKDFVHFTYIKKKPRKCLQSMVEVKKSKNG